MKFSHLLVVGILAGFTAFAVIVGCGDQSPMSPESTQIASPQDGGVAVEQPLDTQFVVKKRRYKADLSSPASSATGHAYFEVSPYSIKYELKAEGLGGFKAAQVYVRKPNKTSGHPVLWIYPERPPMAPGVSSDVEFYGYLDKWDLRYAGYKYQLREIPDLVHRWWDRDLSYVGIVTDSYPDGEIRGDIYPYPRHRRMYGTPQ